MADLTLTHTRAELATARDGLTGTVGVVMTMGALHEGHATLIRQARSECGSVIVTIFVNPLQFGAGEDLSRYPRTLEADLEICQREGADVVFAPSVEDMYPGGEPQVRVSSGRLGTLLEGASRPGHFDGALTVVNKLLHLTRPDRAYFGQKDAQQLILIRRMVRDFDMPMTVVGVPIVREPDGLARSSRNIYLSETEHAQALALSRALAAGEAHAEAGADAVLSAARDVLREADGVNVDYLVLVNEDDLVDVSGAFTGRALLAVAAKVGTTRLIDNRVLNIGARTASRDA